ncbi:glucose-1-phosphate thymidylyltransferase [Streptomyces sp. cf386]|uniref:glucose-1-phosphate thymidylyltransferase n=1 Tax=Streptomyces sp. cf386 TaxID=1761904 RepID=UPI0008872208|nr:glucose-1-phosphate thymidylyltransferase [Streptomyces sp. cf386]SDP01602.1 glucose-1-phosphate thymidylyltransferase [Streptomyces sp. cf386]
MKALLLSGGSGTRLRPITHTSAKQLVPVANKPVLFYGLEALAAAGVREVGIVVGGTAPEVRAAVGDGSRFGVEVTYLPQAEPLGLAHAVLIAEHWLGDDDFVMFLGDNFVEGGITGLVEEFARARSAAHVLVTKVAEPSAFGVAELDDAGRVVRLEEKPQVPRSDLALAGVYFFTPAVHEAVRAISPSARGELEITDAVQWLVDQGHAVRASELTGYWKDTGSVADLLEVNRIVLEGLAPRVDGNVDGRSELDGRVEVAAGAVVRRSRVIGPVSIAAGALIEDSRIGPYTSIGEDCRVTDSGVEYSIVLPGTSIQGVDRIESSLIGRNSDVRPAPRTPGPHHRLILGDHSRVELGA